MNTLDTVLIALIISGATLLLSRLLMPKKKDQGCACGSTNCKVPKPKLNRKKD